MTDTQPQKQRNAVLIFILAFLLYWQTLAPDVLPADNGEFQWVAATLAIAHPPGFPLYTMLAHLMTWLPFGSPAYMINLLSAISSAATVGLVYATVQRLTKQTGAAIVAALALAVATTFWAQATTANVRSFTAFFAALMVYAIVRWQENASPKATERRFDDRWLALFALALGLGVTHHASLAFMGALFALSILMIDLPFLWQPKRWLRPFFALLLGLLPLLYLPLRNPDLRTTDEFLNHVLALGFRGDFFYYLQPDVFTPAILWQRFRIMGNVMTFQFAPVLLAVMAFGLIRLLGQRRWGLAMMLAGSFALHAFITLTYRAPQTVEYMMPAYVLTAVLLGIGVGKRRLWPLLLVSLAFAGWQGWINYPSYAILHETADTRAYLQPILDDAPENAIVLADWHWATPLWYIQDVENGRSDLDVQFVYPEGEPYAETWARRIAEGLASERAVVATHYDETAFATLPAPEPIGEALLYGHPPRQSLPDGFTAIDHLLGDGVRLMGYELDKTAVSIGEETVLTLAWEGDAPINLFAHLVSRDGVVYAQDDVAASSNADGLTLTAFRLTPRLGAQSGRFELLVGATADGVLLNESGAERTSITHVTVTPMTRPPATQNEQLLPLYDGDKQLVGYDWDNTLAVPRLYLHWKVGEEAYETAVLDGVNQFTVGERTFERDMQQWYVPLGQGIVWIGDPALPDAPSTVSDHHFISGRPVLRDIVVSMRLIGYEEDGFHWAWWTLDDSVPAMGAIPTLKWIEGSAVRSPHFTPVSDLAVTGQQLGGALSLYDAFTKRPLPILDERITAEYQWIPLSNAIVE